MHRANEEKYNCGFCGKILKTKLTLVNHVLSHANRRQFECPNCNKIYFTDFDLNCHINIIIYILDTHVIDLCSSKLANKCTLQTHM
jgi:uncharacterized C2H2 Zn-finger protein